MPPTAVSPPREAAGHATGAGESPSARPPGERGRRRGRRRGARVLLALLLALLVTAGGFVAGLFAAPFEVRAAPPPATSVPEVLREAVISAQDARFREHHGVDPLATLGAAYHSLTGGRPHAGSTLTQQHVQEVYLGDDRTLLGQVRAMVLAVRLERRRTKEEILTDHLGALHLGDGVVGVQAAATYYFGVDVQDLDLDEATGGRDPVLALARASMLAGIAPAPSVWPARDPAAARSRQQHTLNAMVADGTITPDQASDAHARRVALVPLQDARGAAPGGVA